MKNDQENVEWLDKIHAGQSEIFSIAWEIEGIAGSFAAVGNGYIAHRLLDIANRLNLAHKKISDGLGEDIANQIQANYDQLGMVLKAALSAADIVHDSGIRE